MTPPVVTLTIDYTGVGGTQTSATVERALSASGPWTFLDTIELLGEMAVYVDNTMPLDVPVFYRTTADTGNVLSFGPFTLAGNGAVYLRDPLRPWADLQFDFCEVNQGLHSEYCTTPEPELVWVGHGDKTRAADVSMPDIHMSETPADIYGRRKRLDGTLQFFSRTVVGYDQVEETFTAGGPLLLQMPAQYMWRDAYVQPEDLVEVYGSRDQRRQFRLWSAPFRIVTRPSGPRQGTGCANWCAVKDTFATFADLTATGDTWLEVAQGTTVCP